MVEAKRLGAVDFLVKGTTGFENSCSGFANWQANPGNSIARDLRKIH
jgi:hypothetical protein